MARFMTSVLVLLLLLVAAGCAERSPSGTESPTGAAPAASPTETAAEEPPEARIQVTEFAVAKGSGPHDVAPAPDGRIWYTAQSFGDLGYLDLQSQRFEHIPLGPGSAPHGVIVGPDGAPWITDGGLNAILRVDPVSEEIRRFDLPPGSDANLNTATFDGRGILWFTGQAGIYGSVNPASGEVKSFEAPKGRGPYGIATAPDGAPWFSSLAGSYIARIDPSTSQLQTFDVPTPGGGARRIWSDSSGRLWVTEYFAGKLARFDPATEQWREWELPGEDPAPYAVFVDEKDIVWVSDFGANAIVRFDPKTERFQQFRASAPNANVRQLLGRPGEVWGAESGTNRLIRMATA
jgi:virginiamycin B lyase